MSPEAIGSAFGLSAVEVFVLNIYSAFWLCTKAMVVIFLQIWVRWTLPRIRIDQVLHACVKVLLPASLVVLLGSADLIAVVDQPKAAIVGGEAVQRLGHLTAEGFSVQMLTQYVLATIFFAFTLLVIGFCLYGWYKVVTNTKQPPKSLFIDVMPVGRDIAYTDLPSEVEEEAGEGEGKPAPA